MRQSTDATATSPLVRTISWPTVAEKSEVESEDAPNVTSYEIQQGRRYLRGSPYLLPCDPTETSRQCLRTLFAITVLGAAACSSALTRDRPMKVLEVGCGSALWTSACHDQFRRLGNSNVSFTGVDIVSLAPDLCRQGVEWSFVQHDLRRYPWPFVDGEFDLIMVKDLNFAVSTSAIPGMIEECLRILRRGGSVEFWETNHIVRCLLPHNGCPVSADRTYTISPEVPFGEAQNKWVRDSNKWIGMACGQRGMSATPSSILSRAFDKHTELVCDVGSKQVAVPLTGLSWETEEQRRRCNGEKDKCGRVRVLKSNGSLLDPIPASIRHAGLMMFIQEVESLEPILMQCSGMNAEEWALWWTEMMSSLLDQNGAMGGECLEIGAWWATKRD